MMSKPQDSEAAQAAQEAALKYAQNKCRTLVNSAKSKSNSVEASKANDASGSDIETGLLDASDDFGIDRNIAKAALTALGTEFTPSAKRGKRVKKKLSEMDEDEKLLASEEAKSLTSRQRRQLRNRVSARHFRLRRKEYISHLEGLVVNMTTKINRLEQCVNDQREENRILKEKLSYGHSPLMSQTPDSNQSMNQHISVLSADNNHFQQTCPPVTISSTVDNIAATPSTSIQTTNWDSPSQFHGSAVRMSADEIRMKPNVVNLLPLHPNIPLDLPVTTGDVDLSSVSSTNMPMNSIQTGANTFDAVGWQMNDDGSFIMFSNGDNTSGVNTGLINMPHSRIYKSILENKVNLSDGCEADTEHEEASEDEKDAVSAKSAAKSGESNEEKMSIIAAEALFKRLDIQMSRLRV